MSKKSKKGKTMALTDFLASEPKLVTVRESTWAAIVAEEEEEQKKTMVVDVSSLPSAPRSAVDVDYSTVPNNPPFVAHIANLSFEIEDDHLRRIFADLDPITARIMRDGTRSRGVGLVEFGTRENLIEALKRTEKEVYGRRIRVKVSEKADLHYNESNRSNFGHRHNRMGEERPEMADNWKRVERKTDESFEDRPRHDFNRDRPNRNDFGRSNFSGHSRDGQRGGDYGYGYPRTRDDRGHDRQGPRQRYNNDDNHRQNTGSDRPRYSSRQSDPRDPETPNDDNREPQKERPRLQLQPRSKPLEEFQPISGSSSSVNNFAANSSPSNTEESPNTNEHSTHNPDEYQRQESHDTSDAGSSVVVSSTVRSLAPPRGAGASIFGGAKPVDTAAKELEIERKLQEMQIANSEKGDDQNERPQPSRSTYQRNQDRDNYRNNDRDQYRQKRPSHNDDYHNRERRDDGRSGQAPDYHHKREYSGGRRYEEDSRRPSDDDYHRRDRDRYNNHPSRRDYGSGKYNHQDRDNYRPRDSNEYNNRRRTSNDSSTSEPQSKPQPKILTRRPVVVPTEDDSNKLQLSNKFVMLDDEDLDNSQEVQSPTVED